MQLLSTSSFESTTKLPSRRHYRLSRKDHKFRVKMIGILHRGAKPVLRTLTYEKRTSMGNESFPWPPPLKPARTVEHRKGKYEVRVDEIK